MLLLRPLPLCLLSVSLRAVRRRALCVLFSQFLFGNRDKKQSTARPFISGTSKKHSKQARHTGARIAQAPRTRFSPTDRHAALSDRRHRQRQRQPRISKSDHDDDGGGSQRGGAATHVARDGGSESAQQTTHACRSASGATSASADQHHWLKTTGAADGATNHAHQRCCTCTHIQRTSTALEPTNTS
jgi:hypothetical protein